MPQEAACPRKPRALLVYRTGHLTVAVVAYVRRPGAHD